MSPTPPTTRAIEKTFDETLVQQALDLFDAENKASVILQSFKNNGSSPDTNKASVIEALVRLLTDKTEFPPEIALKYGISREAATEVWNQAEQRRTSEPTPEPAIEPATGPATVVATSEMSERNNHRSSQLQPDVNQMLYALNLLHPTSGAVELRIPKTKTPQSTWNGFYNDYTLLAQHAAELAALDTTPAVYHTLQQISPGLVNGNANTLQPNAPAGSGTTDKHSNRYIWLPIDADPERKGKVSSTDAEKVLALNVINKIREFLKVRGIESILADSGNGYHLLVRIDLPAGDKELIEALLRGLSAVFSTPEVKIDTSVSNPSRIWKMYGAPTRKGENSPERPWRMSRLLDVPDGVQNKPVSRDVLKSLLDSLKSAAPNKVEKKSIDASPSGDKISHGEHAYELNRIAGKLRHDGMEEDTIAAALIEICEKRCVNYGDDYVEMCERLARKICEKPIGRDLPIRLPAGTPVPTTVSFGLDGFRISGDAEESKPLTFVFENFIEKQGRVAMIGGEKAEKSIFTMRLWMHACCGKSWQGYHCPKVLRVVYFDAELTEEQLDSRYAKLMTEFTSEEQQLIKKNLDLICLKKFTTETEVSVEFTNAAFWNVQAEKYGSHDVAVFDSLYMFYDESVRNQTAEQSRAVKAFERFFKNSTTYVVMHTRKRENKDIKASKNLALRFNSIRPWSDQASGGGTIKKYASTIIGLDRFEELDEDGGIEYQAFDLKFYHRSGSDSPLMTFEVDDLDDGNDLRRRLVRGLGAKAMNIYLQLKKDVGPWASRHQAAKILPYARSKSYPRLDELITKGYILVDPITKALSLAGMTQEIEKELRSTQQKETKKAASKTWLASFLPGTPLYSLIPLSEIKAEAKRLDFVWADVLQAKKELDIKQQDNPSGTRCWHQKRPKSAVRGVKTGAHPKITDGLQTRVQSDNGAENDDVIQS
jgi:hypothetical protein